MKKYLNKLAFYLSFIYTYDVYSKLRKFQNIVLAYSITRKMKSCGKNWYFGNNFFIDNPKFLNIGSNFIAMNDIRIEILSEFNGIKYYPEINIGDNVVFGNRCHLGCINKISIGNNVLFGSNVLIIDHSHGDTKNLHISEPYFKKRLYSKGEVKISENVWIGDNVVILANVHIGKNSIIGANSVVTKDVAENSIFAGIPAVRLKSLNNDN